jgi:hypothetical protein
VAAQRAPATATAIATPVATATPVPTVAEAAATPVETPTEEAYVYSSGLPAVESWLAQSPWPPEMWPTVERVMMCESSGNPAAVGPGGYVGLMQVDPNSRRRTPCTSTRAGAPGAATSEDCGSRHTQAMTSHQFQSSAGGSGSPLLHPPPQTGEGIGIPALKREGIRIRGRPPHVPS